MEDNKMKPIEAVKESETLKNFNLKSFIIGVIIGNIVIGSVAYTYVNRNYVKVFETDAGLFIFRDGNSGQQEIYQLEKLLSEANYSNYTSTFAKKGK